VARIAAQNGWFDACLQNAEQAVEKALKAMIVSRDRPARRSHSTRELAKDLEHLGLSIGLADDDCELIDSIYVPSKYPPDSAMPSAIPDAAICRKCLEIAERVVATAKGLLDAP
jgi:HEPN domain-containing protein